MDYSGTKEFLKQPKMLELSIYSKSARIAHLENFVKKSIYSADNGCVIEPYLMDTLLVNLKHISHTKTALTEDINRFVRLQNHIQNQINSIENPLYRLILEMYYLSGFTLEEIAEKTFYSRRHITRLHTAALKCYENIYGTHHNINFR